MPTLGELYKALKAAQANLEAEYRVSNGHPTRAFSRARNASIAAEKAYRAAVKSSSS